MSTRKQQVLIGRGGSAPIDTEGKSIVGFVITATDIAALGGPSSGVTVNFFSLLHVDVSFGAGSNPVTCTHIQAITDVEIGNIYPLAIDPAAPVQIGFSGSAIPSPGSNFYITCELHLAD